MGFKEEASWPWKILKIKPKMYQKHTNAWVDNLRQKKLDVVTSEGSILYHFNQFGSHMTFLYFQKTLKNQTNQEQIKSKVKNKQHYVLLPNWLK